MRSRHAKVLHRAGGLALVEHVVRAARQIAPAGNIIVVTGRQADAVETLLLPQGLSFVRQTEQKGTGHALECCRSLCDALGADAEDLLMVLYGDTPLLSSHTLMSLRDAQTATSPACTLISTTLDDPSGYGRVILDRDGNVEEIVEQKDCNAEQGAVRVINSGIYCFQTNLLWKHLGEVRPNSISGEYYLTDMARILRCHGHSVRALHIEDPAELLGINTRVELAEADAILRARKARELMLSGVTIERPETVTIDASVTCGQDTIIEPFARLLGNTRIGEDCRVGAGAILESSVLEDGTIIAPYTLIADSHVETGARVGPFARLRMDARVGRNARIGNFVELKKTLLGAGAKSQHLAYLGDSEVGAGSNIGAGTITCNYDGEKKHRTKIGKRAFIGSNATLVAPVEIADDSYVAAGSTITDAVPPGALALSRSRQVTKAGWVAKKRAKK